MKTIKNRTAYGVRFYVRINKVFREIEGVHSFNLPMPQRSVHSVQFLHSDVPKTVVGDYAPEEVILESYFDYSNEVHISVLEYVYSGETTKLMIEFPTGQTCTMDGVFYAAPANSSVGSADSVAFSFVTESKPVWGRKA